MSQMYLLSPRQRMRSLPSSDMLCQWRRFLLNDPWSHTDTTPVWTQTVLSVTDFGKEAHEEGREEKQFLTMHPCVISARLPWHGHAALTSHFMLFPSNIPGSNLSEQMAAQKLINKINDMSRVPLPAGPTRGQTGREGPAQPGTNLAAAAALSSCDWWCHRKAHQHTQMHVNLNSKNQRAKILREH